MRVVIINCFDTYQHRVNSLGAYFRSNGWEVTKLCSDFSHRSKSTVSPQSDDCVYLPTKPYQKNLSVARMQSHYDFAQRCRDRLNQMNETPDLLWVLLPPNSLAKMCSQYKKEHSNTKLIFDLIDLWPETFPAGGIKWLPPFYIWRQLRDRYLPQADHIVTECRLYQKRLGLREADASTLYMCQQNLDCKYDPKLNLKPDYISLCYLGSVNHIIDIDAIASLIAQFKKSIPVKLHIIGSGERLEQLVDAASAAGAEIECHGVIFDSKEKQKIFDQCHFGLNMMKSSVCVGLTMKSVDYFAGGLPVLNSIHGDTWDLLEQYQAGINWQAGENLDLLQFDREAMGRNARHLFDNELGTQQLWLRIGHILTLIRL